MNFGRKMFFAISKGSVNRLSANIPNEVTFRRNSFLKAQSYMLAAVHVQVCQHLTLAFQQCFCHIGHHASWLAAKNT